MNSQEKWKIQDSLMCFGEKEIYRGRWILGLWTGQGQEQKGRDPEPQANSGTVIEKAGCVLERHRELKKGALWTQPKESKARRTKKSPSSKAAWPGEVQTAAFLWERSRQQPFFGKSSSRFHMEWARPVA